MATKPSLRTRTAGVLLHPTSLPGPSGIGDLGEEAHRFADFLASAGQSWWQMLPLGPTGFGNSPYSALSSWAGNPLLVSLERLARESWLPPEEAAAPDAPPGRVAYGEVEAFKGERLRRAFAAFEARAAGSARDAFEEFRRAAAEWLPDYALYRALKEAHGGAAWTSWEDGVRRRDPAALGQAHRALAPQVRFHEFVQFAFERQWAELRRHCAERGVGLIGDVPFYVSHDSADVWAHQDLFDLGRRGRPRRVAGVPPDLFSRTGQLWGFPIYRWERHRERGFDWWLSRFRGALARFDAVRIDHFIGFHRAWAVPARLRTALRGRWIPAPGEEIFERLRAEHGSLGLVAEDLGIVTPEVEALRDRFDLPGIRVLQFAFDGTPENPHLPHRYPRRVLAATGTHDNDTSRGWFESLESPDLRTRVLEYLGTDGREIHWDMIAAVFRSAADTAIVPAQDLLGLGSEARMNRPGQPSGNWDWRLLPGALTNDLAARLRALTESCGRLPAPA